jgi:hypothetical protein
VAKAFGASNGNSLYAIAELFEYTEKFLRRLDTYTNIPQTPEMQEVIVKLLTEVLSVLGIATKVIGTGTSSELIIGDGRPLLAYPCSETSFMKLVGYTDIDDALRRLDKATQKEALAVATQALDVAYRFHDEVIHVASEVEDVSSSMKDIGSRVKRLEGQINPSWEIIDSAQTYACIIMQS